MLPFLCLFVMKKCASMDSLGNYRTLSGCNNNNNNRSVCCFTCLCCFNAVSYRYRRTSSRSLFSNWSIRFVVLYQVTNFDWCTTTHRASFSWRAHAEIRHFDVTRRLRREQRGLKSSSLQKLDRCSKIQLLLTIE